LRGLVQVNPVRNSSGALNPALRGGTPYGAEPGIILKPNPAAASGSESLWLGEPPAQPPAQKSLWLGERASLRGMSPSGAEPGPEGLRLGEPLARKEQRGIISNGVKNYSNSF